MRIGSILSTSLVSSNGFVPTLVVPARYDWNKNIGHKK